MPEPGKKRMQPASATLWIMLYEFRQRRIRRGPKWCEEKLIGPMRRDMAAAPPAPSAVVGNRVIWLVGTAHEEAQEILAQFCHGCGLCSMADFTKPDRS